MAKQETNNPIKVREITDHYESIRKLQEAVSGSYSSLPNIRDVLAHNYGRLFSSEDAEIQDRISNLRKELRDKSDELTAEKRKGADVSAQMTELQDKYEELKEQTKLQHILSRICEPAKPLLLKSSKFGNSFEHLSECETVVMSIDIRRSTELMLKAKKPSDFSEFITAISESLAEIVKENYGIFDKFTGDGVLAFFPKFYSGEDALLRAIIAAHKCHLAFNKIYNSHRTSFSVVIKDIGLGIGIDYGNVALVNNSRELTVVGVPVVYACRFSGAKAGDTLLNQSAREEVVRHCKTSVIMEETEIHIKNEGTALAYKVVLDDLNVSLNPPDWSEYSDDTKEEMEEERN
jgi:class 3 adenylate cyclase